jgi:hypothetical protein
MGTILYSGEYGIVYDFLPHARVSKEVEYHTNSTIEKLEKF